MPTRSLNRDRLRVRTTPADGEHIIDLREGRQRRRSGRNPGGTHPTRINPVDLTEHAQLRQSRFFGSPAFRRLWFSQVLSSTGDWIGLVALTAIASQEGGAFAMGAVSLVIAARLIPGLFMSPFVGVLVDRWDRKRIMVITDVGRGIVLCFLPFWHNLLALFVASLMLELMTLMWSPAKEATVPNIVRKSFLPTANSMSLAAAYGTFVPAMALYTVLSKVPDWLGGDIAGIGLDKHSVALYFDALTYVLSAAVIATLAIPKRPQRQESVAAKPTSSFREALDGWQYVASNRRVRTVILGMSMGLIGGGVVVPLGVVFAEDVLGAGSSGYGLLLTAMGVGTAIGVVGVSVLQRRMKHGEAFAVAAIGAGVALAIGSGMNGLGASVSMTGVFGLFAGAIYVLGFTILQTSVPDEFRGRVFAAFYTVTRLCLLLALISAPLLSIGLDRLADFLFDGDVNLLGADYPIPGVRLTLWLGAAIVFCAGLVAMRTMRRSPSSASVADQT